VRTCVVAWLVPEVWTPIVLYIPHLVVFYSRSGQLFAVAKLEQGQNQNYYRFQHGD